jgi:hypothetical protein
MSQDGGCYVLGRRTPYPSIEFWRADRLQSMDERGRAI